MSRAVPHVQESSFWQSRSEFPLAELGYAAVLVLGNVFVLETHHTKIVSHVRAQRCSLGFGMWYGTNTCMFTLETTTNDAHSCKQLHLVKAHTHMYITLLISCLLASYHQTHERRTRVSQDRYI